MVLRGIQIYIAQANEHISCAGMTSELLSVIYTNEKPFNIISGNCMKPSTRISTITCLCIINHACQSKGKQLISITQVFCNAYLCTSI